VLSFRARVNRLMCTNSRRNLSERTTTGNSDHSRSRATHTKSPSPDVLKRGIMCMVYQTLLFPVQRLGDLRLEFMFALEYLRNDKRSDKHGAKARQCDMDAERLAHLDP
jgi:hypothetical protein